MSMGEGLRAIKKKKLGAAERKWPACNELSSLGHRSPKQPHRCSPTEPISWTVRQDIYGYCATHSNSHTGIRPHLSPSSIQLIDNRQEDLYAFHQRVLGAPAPRFPILNEHSAIRDTAGLFHGEEAEEEDDDLGYYPDGYKRTLTDDQIAMFRHSEIYAIIRGRQIRKENEEAERNGEQDEEQSTDVVVEPREGAPGEVNTTSSEPVKQSDLVEPPNVFDDAGDKRKTQKPGGSAGPPVQKRKHQHLDAGSEHARLPPSRRSVRELDSAVAADVELDYGGDGDEADQVSDARADPPLPPPLEKQPIEEEGRKIWWPALEG